jgi:hypothetical protein
MLEENTGISGGTGSADGTMISLRTALFLSTDLDLLEILQELLQIDQLRKIN